MMKKAEAQDLVNQAKAGQAPVRDAMPPELLHPQYRNNGIYIQGLRAGFQYALMVAFNLDAEESED